MHSSSLDNSAGLPGHSDNPYETKYDASNYHSNFWTPQIHANEAASPGGQAAPISLQVKASVSPPGGSPISSTSAGNGTAVSSAVNSHVHTMSHQSYPTYHYHNPYHPASMDLAYFGGQNYNMVSSAAAANTAAMFRSDAYDAYQQAASASTEGRYQLL